MEYKTIIIRKDTCEAFKSNILKNTEQKNCSESDMTDIISNITSNKFYESEILLDFCDKYGLLQYSKDMEHNCCIYLSDLIYYTEMIRVLTQVCYWNQDTPQVKEELNNENIVLEIITCIFKLLLRKYEDILEKKKPRNLLQKDHIIDALASNHSISKEICKLIDHTETIFEGLDCILDNFIFNMEELITYKNPDKILNILNTKKDELLELLIEICIEKINHEIESCIPYIQRKMNNGKYVNIAEFSCSSLYHKLLVYKISLYICSDDERLRRCNNPKCNCLFEVFPGRRSQKDKKFCSHKCASYIAKQKFNNK